MPPVAAVVLYLVLIILELVAVALAVTVELQPFLMEEVAQKIVAPAAVLADKIRLPQAVVATEVKVWWYYVGQMHIQKRSVPQQHTL
jgi:hypothetical protein